MKILHVSRRLLFFAGSMLLLVAPLGAGQGARTPAPVAPYDDYTGFTKLWDGATFTHWDGESDVWSIADGALHADTTKTPGQHHIRYTGPGAVMRDFDLKVEVKLSATGANGGVQYRSRLLHPSHGGTIGDPLGRPLPAGITTFAQAVAASPATEPPARGGGGGRGGPTGPNGPSSEPNPWQVSGYQLDLDSNNVYTGQLYEGQGRGIVTPPCAIVELRPGRVTAKIATLCENTASIIKPHHGAEGEWNQLEIIARGNTLIHIINGKVVSVTIDDNPDFRAFQGILSLQLEGNGQIWYRNVYVKPL
jgi:hypothetical protein